MKTLRKFRPAAVEPLEDRSVPSGFGGDLIGSLPAQDARQVARAFETFEHAYETAVRTDLLVKVPNTTQFTKDASAAFTALNSSLTTAISNLPTASALGTTIQGQVNNLQTELNGLTTTPPAARKLLRQVDFDISQTSFQVVQEVRSAPTPTGTVDSATLSRALESVFRAFGTFNKAYSSAIQKDLLAPKTTNPSSNSVAFQNDVSTALTSLSGDVTAALSGLPPALTTTLKTTVQNDLTTGSTSLQAQLQGIALPQNTNFFTTLLFRFRSGSTIVGGQAQVVHDIVNAVHTYNNSLGSGGTTTPA